MSVECLKQAKEDAVKRRLKQICCLLMLMGVLSWSLPAWAGLPSPLGQEDDNAWDTDSRFEARRKRKRRRRRRRSKPKPRKVKEDNLPQPGDVDNDNGQDEDKSDTGGDNEASTDAGPSTDGPSTDGGPTDVTPESTPTPEALGADQVASDAGGTAPTAGPPGSSTSPPGSTDNVPVAPTTPKTMAIVGVGQLAKPDTDAKLSAWLEYEQMMMWGSLLLLALAALLQFLHALLPFGGLRFLSFGAHFGLVLSFLGLFGVLGLRWMHGQSPGGNLYSGLVLFSTSALFFHLWRRRHTPSVYLSALPVSLIAGFGVAWALGADIPTLSLQLPQRLAVGSRLLGNALMFIGFGGLATAAGWMLSSGYLGMLAKRMRGRGYGLEPEMWTHYRLQPTAIVIVAYPLLTVAWVAHVIWSVNLYGVPWKAWVMEPRLGTTFVVWLLLSAFVLALRLPQKGTAAEEKPRPRGWATFLLFFATAGGATFFIWADLLINALRV